MELSEQLGRHPDVLSALLHSYLFENMRAQDQCRTALDRDVLGSLNVVDCMVGTCKGSGHH